MAKLTVSLYGKDYFVNCDEGEENRLRNVIAYVESKMETVEARAGNATDLRLMMLTCLTLADELIEARKAAATNAVQDEELILAAVNHLKDRVANIASQVGRA